MSLVRNDDGPGILDDAVLDEFNIPFGSWIEEAVNWITLNMGGALDVMARMGAPWVGRPPSQACLTVGSACR